MTRTNSKVSFSPRHLTFGFPALVFSSLLPPREGCSSSPALLFPLHPPCVFVYSQTERCQTHVGGMFSKGYMLIVLKTGYAILLFSQIIWPFFPPFFFPFFFYVCVCALAGWGACGHTSTIRRVAGPRRTRWPFRFPAVHHLDQREEERWRAANGTLQVNAHARIHAV